MHAAAIHHENRYNDFDNEILLMRAQNVFPEGFKAHPKLARLLGTKLEMADGNRPLDWAAGEPLRVGA